MNEPADNQDPGIVNAFLLRYLEDRNDGKAVSLEDYQAAFPGHEAAIAREFERLHSDEVDDTPPEVSISKAMGLAGPGVARDRIGPYKLLSVLGEGGMGVVYLAEQTEPIQRRVALKLIKLGMDTREVIARFDSERQALAMMDHVSIARVYDAGTTEQGRPFFVMESVPGVPITQYCDRHKLKTGERLELLRQVCEGVQHAHQKGIIHRDIKPSNILVTLDSDGKPVPKIIDFGVSKSVNQRLTEQTLFTEQGQIIGTPEYMSPEQAEMSALDIDTRTDIYSLGALLYELLVGSLPFDSQTLRKAGYLELQRQIIEKEPPRPSARLESLGEEGKEIAHQRSTEPRALLREVRGDLDWIVLHAMEKDRSRRYASASELSADIRRFMSHEPVIAGPPSVFYRAEKFLRKNRLAMSVAMCVVILSLLTVVLTRESSRRSHLKTRTDSAQKLIENSDTKLRNYASVMEKLAGLQSAWDKASLQHRRVWLPIWEKEIQDHLVLNQEVRQARENADALYSQSVTALHNAIQLAPPDSQVAALAREKLSGEYRTLLQVSRKEGGTKLQSGFWESLIEAFDLSDYVRDDPVGTAHIKTDPPGAEIYCFRYDRREFRLQPIAFDAKAGLDDPAKGLLHDPYLVIDRVWDPSRSPFLDGDRIIKLNGETLSLRGDFAAALAGMGQDEKIGVRVLREGKELDLSWIPFKNSNPERVDFIREPRKRPIAGEVLNIFYQFGFTFAGYPLAFDERCLAGTTSTDSALDLRLPQGSYLLVFRLEGYGETRYPFTIPWNHPIDVRLVKKKDIPPDFVYIPAGPFDYGGDPEAFQSLRAGTMELGGYFMSRHEVTFKDYVEFLNDIGVNPDSNEGKVKPQASWAYLYRQGIMEEPQAIDLIPRNRYGKPLIDYRDHRWQRSTDARSSQQPVVSTSYLAALEYAHWFAKKKQDGRWRFRLPTDHEWEKAARGTDRRIHVWGDDPVWSFAYTQDGKFSSRELGVIGMVPEDESPYGVRDLTGSVCEPTQGQVTPRHISRRGGNWYQMSPYGLRTATRNGRYVTGSGVDMGIRLVAELPSKSD